MRIWLDTDIGTDVDDALALAYVLRHPDCELAGVSTVFGDVPLRGRIAEALLRVADATSVPLVAGLGVPLTPERKGVMLGHEGKGILDDPAPERRVERETGGDARIAALAEALEQAAPDVLVAIGPLTNLGALARAGVALPPLAIMGGKSADAPGENAVPQISEWNWFCDPVAVEAVLAAEHRTRPRIVPGEVTFRTQLEDGDVARLAGGDALARALSTLCSEWLTAQSELLGSEHPLVRLHDPLTAAILVESGLCPFEARRVRVDETGAAHTEPGPPNIDVATDVDPRAVRDHLMNTWLSANGERQRKRNEG